MKQNGLDLKYSRRFSSGRLIEVSSPLFTVLLSLGVATAQVIVGVTLYRQRVLDGLKAGDITVFGVPVAIAFAAELFLMSRRLGLWRSVTIAMILVGTAFAITMFLNLNMYGA